MNGQGVYLSKHLRWHFADITPDKSNAEVSLTIEVSTYTLKTFALFLFKCTIILMALYYTTKLMLKAMANFICVAGAVCHNNGHSQQRQIRFRVTPFAKY